jgi:hypothetical protein
VLAARILIGSLTTLIVAVRRTAIQIFGIKI